MRWIGSQLCPWLSEKECSYIKLDWERVAKHRLLQNKATGWEALMQFVKLCRTMVGSEWLPTQRKSWPLPTRNWSSTRLIPRDCRILSDDYLTIFLNILLCRLQFTSTGVEVGFIASCTRQLFEELDRILQLFGHVPASTHSMQWLVAFSLATQTDPSTSRVVKGWK